MEFLKKAAGFIVILALLGGMGWAFGPDLWQDYKVRNAQTVQNTNFRIKEAECKSKLFIVSLCTIELQDIQSPSLKHSFYYLIFSNMGGERLNILNVQGQDGIYTTNIGQDYFMNRAISFVGVFSFFVLCLFGLLVGKRRDT